MRIAELSCSPVKKTSASYPLRRWQVANPSSAWDGEASSRLLLKGKVVAFYTPTQGPSRWNVQRSSLKVGNRRSGRPNSRSLLRNILKIGFEKRYSRC